MHNQSSYRDPIYVIQTAVYILTLLYPGVRPGSLISPELKVSDKWTYAWWRDIVLFHQGRDNFDNGTNNKDDGDNDDSGSGNANKNEGDALELVGGEDEDDTWGLDQDTGNNRLEWAQHLLQLSSKIKGSTTFQLCLLDPTLGTSLTYRYHIDFILYLFTCFGSPEWFPKRYLGTHTISSSQFRASTPSNTSTSTTTKHGEMTTH
ncbi:hypothetical protein BC941DRAFT_477407 [Chlamydoabsidia padenii]|nr:hypothetical protein BC941DRAFT_477407 [Chlamydoabsidia padenii]